MKSLVLLRGLPGAGKSSLAAVLARGSAPVFAIDDYFTDVETGRYEFRHAENHMAYKQCADRAEEAMKEAFPLVIIDNAFTLEWEMETYFKLAMQYGYRIHVVTVEKRHSGKNVHGVTEEQLRKMAEKYRVVLF
jgi:predicted kinase